MSVQTTIDVLVQKTENSLILISGESGTAKDELAYRFIEDGIKQDEAILCVLLSHSVQEYLDKIKEKTDKVGEYIASGRLNFIDCFTFRAIPKEKLPNTTVMGTANDLLGLSVKINELSHQSERLRIVFDQISVLMIYNSPMHVVQFIQTLAARVRQRGQSALLVLDTGVIDAKIEKTLQSVVDTFVETSRRDSSEGTKQLVRIKFSKYEFEPRLVQIE